MIGVLLLQLLAHAGPATSGPVNSAGIPPIAANCSMLRPPENSGEVLGDEPEFDVKVYPRLSDFPRHYTGCQLTWRSENGKWVLFTMAYFEKGKVITFYAPGGGDGGGDVVCRYRGRKMIEGSDDTCPDPSDIALPSMPAGCGKRTRAEHDEPKGCEDDAPAR